MKWTRLAAAPALWIAILAVGLCETSSAQWINAKPYPVPTTYAQLNAIVSGPDGALWFTEWCCDKIGRMTTAGTVTEYPLPPVPNTNCGQPGVVQCGPSGITAGPDGALWFTVGNGNAIGRITTAGAITMYSIPGGGGPRGIAAGPDGALWFAEYDGGNTIGRITTSGVITQYPLPTVCGSVLDTCRPFGIVAGPDGAMWFAEQFGGIGRITTTGAITEYPVGNAGSFFITAGPDGALWFTEEDATYLGRITVNGDVTRFPLPSVGGQGITAGPDGALWFSMDSPAGSFIGRATTSGIVTLYPVPHDLAYGMTTGPDGAIWFTDYNSKVWRMPACGLGLRASFANSTLSLNFALGITAPATFSLGYYSSTGLNGLGSTAIPAIVPPATFSQAWGPGFPSIGNIGVVSALKDSATGEFQCAEWQIVDTGGTGATTRELQEEIGKGFSK